MSRVERTENPTERRGNEHLRQAERGRDSGSTRQNDSNPGHTPTKAEGDVADVEEALNHQKE
ncbi:MAG TPA: hypothetical protein VE010_13845 [Thermoanaerobaculia bacterium]|nr:hypothetical protein [Thermoanaerobaculia bacterium]